MDIETTIFFAAFVILGASLVLSRRRDDVSAPVRERRRAAEAGPSMRPVLLFSTTRPPVALC